MVASVKGDVLSIIFSKWLAGVCLVGWFVVFFKKGKCTSESPTVRAKGPSEDNFQLQILISQPLISLHL